MRAWALAFAACLVLASQANADFEFQTLQEELRHPESSGGTYAIVQNGQVVGIVEHVSSSRVFGRRGGPTDVPSASAARAASYAAEMEAAAEQLAQMFSTHIDLDSAVQERLMAIRCPRARIAALAQLQLAAAAAAAAAGGAGAGLELDLPQGMLWMQQQQGQRISRTRAQQSGVDELDQAFEMMQQKLFGEEVRMGEEMPNTDIGVVSSGPMDLPAGLPDSGLPGASSQPQPPDMGWGVGPQWDEEFAGQQAWEPQQPQQPEEEAGPHSWFDRMRRGWGQEHGPEHEHHQHHGHGTHEHHGHEHHEHGPEHEHHGPEHHEHHEHGFKHGGGEQHWRPEDPVHHTVPIHPRGVGPLPALPEGFEMTLDGVAGQYKRWLHLQDTAAPVPREVPDMSWRIRDAEGALNWGYLSFLGLASACVAVWGALLTQYALYRSARAATNASAAYYLARSDSPEGNDLKGSGAGAAGGEGSLESGPLKPLQREGPAKEGVEYASSHVLGGQAIVQVLQYQPLPGNEQ